VKGLTNITRIAVGANYSVALKADGTVWSWGYNSFGELGNGGSADSDTPKQTLDLTDVTEIAAGYNHVLALKKDGTVWTWGYDSVVGRKNYRPIKVQGLTDVRAISAGYRHSLVVRKDGKVLAWGENGYGQLGTGSTSSTSSPMYT
ncbi:hypothetical protein MRS84_22775, partial [Escherichia coli]|uniref:RCC1 domain-containing protein n=2 Tax=Bacteria TaxID=2 RepID=UPI0034D975E9|nr:hypothetical protein [Escherichia coli]